MKTERYSYRREARVNPYIGFTSFQHFGTDVLYSDLVVRPENNMTETEHVECYPVPAYVKEEGKSEGYYPDSSVAYIRILWKEFEPRECEYRYELIEDILARAERAGQSVMFRIMQHSTREEDDVPDWLKEKIECPARPKGARFKESPRSPLFLEYFERTVRAFAERFDSNPTLSMIDVSLPGAWGEGDSCEFFTDEELRRLVDCYTDSFKSTHIIAQVCRSDLVHYMNERANVGWRADCIGHPKLLAVNVTEAEREMPEVWRRGHVSFESYWWLGEWQRKGWSIDDVIEKTLSWHISSFNGKSLPIPNEWREKIDAWCAKMGYHYVIDAVHCEERVSCKEGLSLTLDVDNVGVAPIYHSLPLYVKLKSPDKEYLFDTGVDIREWMPGKRQEKISLSLPRDMSAGEYALEVGIGGEGGVPAALFASDAPLDGDFSLVARVSITE